jgi:hypothetical protein
MLVSLRLSADFSRGCAGKRIGHLLFATHPTRRSGDEAKQRPQRPSEPFCRADSRASGYLTACGAGNFLSVSLQQLPNSEREIITFAAKVGLLTSFPKVGPEQISRGRG